MKKIIRIMLSTLLVFSLIFTAVIPASAARPGTQFLSELQLAQASDAETAKAMLTDAGYKVFDKNLNPEGDDAVYLGYKTSADVEDAITDISVMNMNGGFNITDYELILEESLNEYKLAIGFFRTAAEEFAANYKAGTKEAKLAYRQLNYYYIEKDGVKTLMGDYMLSFPEDDGDFAEILMKGNVNILANIRALLAMGVGDAEKTLIEKVAEKAKDPQVMANYDYYEDAKTLYNTVLSVDKDINTIAQNIEEIEADETLTEEERTELVEQMKSSISKHIAFRTIFDALPCGDSTYGKYFEENGYNLTDYSLLYPVIAAMSPGQRALIPYGQVISIFLYDSIETDLDELEAQLAEQEADFTELDVFFGTDMEIFEGSFAITEETMRLEASTGQSWTKEMMEKDREQASIINSVIGAGAIVLTSVSAVFLTNAIKTASAYSSYITQYNNLMGNLDYLQDSLSGIVRTFEAASKRLYDVQNGATTMPLSYAQTAFNRAQESLASTYAEYCDVQTSISDLTGNATVTSANTGALVFSTIGVVTGLALIGYSIYNFVKIANSYKIEYTDIPMNMVDCVDTENGDRFIRYHVVNSFYEKDGKTQERAGDLNAYDGEQWNALYYTKNYEAGKCLLATADWPVSDGDFGRYAPVHMFGAEVCYDLNKYTKQDAPEKIFLAFQTSNAKKAAASSVPTVVGSSFNYGVAGISGVVGIGIGMCLMGLIKKKKEG